MKVVFMGTPDFAVPTLEKMYDKGYDIGYVVTQPDTARDRGKKIKFTKVKEKAIDLGITVLQPEKVRGNEELLEKLRNFAPDVIVVAAYGQILPKELLEIPTKACINVHGSILPKYRGAAPIQRAIWDGEDVTGVTIMEMAEGLDTGDMISKVEVPIERLDTGQLFDKLSIKGAELLINTLENIDNLLEKKVKQNDEDATYAKMLFKEDGKLEFGKSAKELDCQIRALSPQPGAFGTYKGEKIKIFNPEVVIESAEPERASKVEPGEIVKVDKNGILIKTGRDFLLIKEIQVSGKKRMKVSDYLAGNSIDVSEKL